MDGANAPSHGTYDFHHHASPWEPFDPAADNANPLSPEAQRNMAKQYGLDKPLWQQFVIFLAKAVRGDFGTSYVYKNRAVHEIIRQAFPVSLHLGDDGARRRARGWIDPRHQCRSIPESPSRLPLLPYCHAGGGPAEFCRGGVFILLFSLVLQLVPTGGWDAPRHWLLPTLTLALGPMAMIARFTRSTMIDVMRADFVLPGPKGCMNVASFWRMS